METFKKYKKFDRFFVFSLFFLSENGLYEFRKQILKGRN